MDLPPTHAFLSGENLTQFWKYMKWVLFYIAPGLMIAMCFPAVGKLIEIIKNIFSDDHEKEDEKDDYDVRYYD
ncbi:hypothetical protein ACS47_04945 [Bacillus cereus]|uniref:hypothetical protein n=1 Tax=Bacillus cereus group TaxID=86661 RepID=UPI0001A047A5|nr:MULTISPECIES: hypothetical protein [Bacillus cereus group]EEK97302.1 hypothetical protein bcere0013_55720 [Bacillus cereus BDRD-ST26]KXI92719.1 hypothetical protein ACS47_04945 [Bacillus cereus]KXI93322.1 hypothetical protein ACS46_06520 [Bacillus cereus]MBE7112490.1 hypothetical protein [Bacillus paranthracis]MCC2477963.1 hypothetical protein [Bacillus paranthracis]